MATLSNTPAREFTLRLQARKSFILGIYIKDTNGRPLNITGATLRLIVKKQMPAATVKTDALNLITNSLAELVAPLDGYARLNLQASDLNHPAGEYPYALVLIDGGYSAVLAHGTLELVANTEVASIGSTYSGLTPASALHITLRGGHSVDVFTGPILAPGTTSFTDTDKAKLDTIETGAQVNANVVMLNPDGEIVNLTLASVADSTTRLAMTPAERTKLAGPLGVTAYSELTGRPTLGTIAARAASDFLEQNAVDAADVVSGVFAVARLPKLTTQLPSGTAVPTGGADGDFYFQYTV